LSTAVGALAAAIVFVAASAWAVAWFSMHPPRVRRRHPDTPASIDLPFEDLCFLSRDGTPLSGWLIPHTDARAVLLLCHGMQADRAQMLQWVPWLHEVGYALLLFDFRRLGRSGGDLCTMGLREPDDALAAVDWLQGRPDMAGMPVGLLGFSMGGVAGLLAAARDERIRCVVSHGAYATLDEAITQRCRKHFGPFARPVEWGARTMGAMWFPRGVDEVAALMEVHRIPPRPLLLLNGRHDRIVPPHNAERMAAAVGGSCETWILPNSAHDYPAPTDEQEYRRRVLLFLDRWLTNETAR
jgi:fermentation-respiration switch protein FrsA (DUF1100 family)